MLGLYKSRFHNGVLTHIKEGMKVHDVTGKMMGTVTYVQFGDEEPLDSGNEMLTGYEVRANSFGGGIMDVFGEDISYSSIEAHLLRSGYVKIDGGLFTNDRYATPDQIALIISHRLELNVRGEELVSL